ncbi:MAG: nuclear transport factor 2 family protein [Actinomycetota bacterium]|nr:nuclear transport factor 2 family protein [Actinomycetota bacterium]
MSTAQRFADALQELERTRDLDAFVQMFSDEAHLVRPEGRGDVTGKDGARQFWQAYLDQFDEIGSRFSRIEQDGRLGELEWTGTGRLRTGRPLSYAGVSLLEVDDDGLVTRFATYYDTAAFLTPSAGAAGQG